MVWTPPNAVINSRAIAENLLTYFEANQVEAILWAHGSALKPIARFENSRANVNLPVYPAVLLSDDNDRQELGNDQIDGAYTVLILVMIQNSNPTLARSHAESYDKALKSMIANCGTADLDDLEINVGCVTGTVVLQTIEGGFDQIKGHETNANDWMQQFEIRANYTLTAGAY